MASDLRTALKELMAEAELSVRLGGNGWISLYSLRKILNDTEGAEADAETPAQ